MSFVQRFHCIPCVRKLSYTLGMLIPSSLTSSQLAVALFDLCRLIFSFPFDHFFRKRSKVNHLLRCAITFLLSPPFCLVYFCLASTLLFPPADVSPSNPTELLSYAVKMVLDGVAWSYNSWFFVGSWLYPFVCAVS